MKSHADITTMEHLQGLHCMQCICGQQVWSDEGSVIWDVIGFQSSCTNLIILNTSF